MTPGKNTTQTQNDVCQFARSLRIGQQLMVTDEGALAQIKWFVLLRRLLFIFVKRTGLLFVICLFLSCLGIAGANYNAAHVLMRILIG